jgi:hypothetical protein
MEKFFQKNGRKNKMNKTQISVITVIAMLVFTLSSVPSAFASLPSGYSEPTYYDTDWYFWYNDSDSLAILLFGGVKSSPGPTIYAVNSDNADKMALISCLIDNGFDVITLADTRDYWVDNIYDYWPGYEGGNPGNSWLNQTAYYLKTTYSYSDVYLFGYSAGAAAVGYEIQKPCASSLYSAAVIAAGPVNCSASAIQEDMYGTALRAENVSVRTSFIANENDDTAHCVQNGWNGVYNQSQLYYNNTNPDVIKEWHEWEEGSDAHDVFPDKCLVCSKTLPHVVYDWFTGPILKEVDIVIDSDAQGDPYLRHHGMTVDDPMSHAFMNENPSPVIATTSGTLHYETTVYLAEGPHNIEYAVACYVGYWNVTITVDDEVVVDSENSDAYNHVVAEIYVEPQNCTFDIEAYTIYNMELPVWIKIDGEEVGTAFETYELSNGTYTFEVPQYVWFGMYTAYFLYWDYQDVHYDDITAEITINSEEKLRAIYDFN